MDESRLNIANGEYTLKLGNTFPNQNSKNMFHTLKCKFLTFIKFKVQAKKYFFLVQFFLLTHIFLNISDDFKPASVDVTKDATVQVSSNNQVTVTAPNLGKFSLLFFSKNFPHLSFLDLFEKN